MKDIINSITSNILVQKMARAAVAAAIGATILIIQSGGTFDEAAGIIVLTAVGRAVLHVAEVWYQDRSKQATKPKV